MSRQYTKIFSVLSLSFISIAVIIVYSNILHGEFQFDDRYTVVENTSIKKIDSFLPGNWPNLIFHGNRPVTEFTFALNYRLKGLDVSVYHATNILIHLFTVFLAYIFIRKTLKTAGIRDNAFIAFIVSAVFALHPVQTQTVSYISQRAVSLCAFFYLGSLLVFIYSIGAVKISGRILLYLFGVILFGLAIESKETAVSLPFILLLYDCYFFRERPFKKKLFFSGPLILAGTAGAILFLLKTKGSQYVGFSIDTISPMTYMLTQIKVLATYIRLVLLPINLNLDYNYPLTDSFPDPRLLLPLVFIMTAFLLSVCLLLWSKKTQNPGARIASFGIIWFFVLLMPTSSFVPLRDVIFEHRIYLASLGLILSLTCISTLALNPLSAKYRVGLMRSLSGVFAVIMLLSFSVASYARNFLWQNDLTMARDVAVKSQGKPRVHYNYGYALLKRGLYRDALSEFMKALAAKDDGSILREDIYNNAGITMMKMNDNSSAVDMFLKGLETAPMDPYLLDNLASALYITGRSREALKYIQLNIKAHPQNAGAYRLAGKIYFDMRRYREALEQYIMAEKTDPNNADIYWDLALTSEKIGNAEDASRYWKHYFLLRQDEVKIFQKRLEAEKTR